jgi:hypothetical protein
MAWYGVKDVRKSDRSCGVSDEEHLGHNGQHIPIDQVGMTPLEGVQVLLAHAPLMLRATVDLAGAIHRQAGRFVRDDQPFHPIDVWLVRAEVIRVPIENRLRVRRIALQDEGAGANGGLGFLQVAELLHHLWGDDPCASWVRQRIDESDVGLFEQELHGIAVRHFDPVYGPHHIAVRICLFCQEAIVGEFDIPGHQLSAVEGGLLCHLTSFGGGRRRWSPDAVGARRVGQPVPVSGPGYLDAVEYLLSGAHGNHRSWTGRADRVESPGPSQQPCGL